MSLFLVLVPGALGCSSHSNTSTPNALPTISVAPASPYVTVQEVKRFTATMAGGGSSSVMWSVVESNGGSISATGDYTAPATPGTFHVRATSSTISSVFGEAAALVVAKPIATITVAPYATESAPGIEASVPEQSGNTFTWTLDGGTITSGAGTRKIAFTAGNTGTVNLQCKVANPAGSEDSGQAHVTIQSRPLIQRFDPGVGAIAPGGSTQLLALFTGGKGVVNPGNLPITSGVALAVAPAQTTTYLLTVSNDAGATASAQALLAVGDINPPTDPKPGQLWTDPATQLVLAYCPADSYQMGAPDSDPDSTDNERPVHSVSFPRGYWISQSKITQAQWMQLLVQNPSFFYDRDACTKFGNEPLRPVEQVSWEDAQAYLAKLNARLGWCGYRLPSESEWEHAYRAGTTSRFFWGEDPLLEMPKAYGWHEVNSGLTPQRVGLLGLNPWNLLDMSGNAMEWCADNWQEDYFAAPAFGRALWNPLVTMRVLRGSAWNDPEIHGRATMRYTLSQDQAYRTAGLRVVRLHRDMPRLTAFTATPAGPLPIGGGTVKLDWAVQGATRVWIDQQLGDVQGTSLANVKVDKTTLFVLVAENDQGWVMTTVRVEVQK